MERDSLLRILDTALEEASEVLDLSGLGLAELPPEIGQFGHVRRLFLADNHLTTLPPEIAQLTALELLDVRRNRLRDLPAALATLPNLAYLWLGGNDLVALPPVVTRIPGLQRLVLRHNRLTTLPPEIGELTQLRELSLQDNRLEHVPEEIGRLAALELLFLSGNVLTTLPVALRELTALQRLDLSGNQLRDLPVGLHRLTALVQLDLRKNPIAEDVPAALLAEPEDVEAMRVFSRQRDMGHRLPLREGRLVVVGSPGVGKSALIRRLREEPFAAAEAASGLLTMRVWSLPDTSTEGDKVGDPIRLNVWELAGSVAARGVYPWLLAPGTMMLLVVEERDGEAARQVGQWLNRLRRPGVEIPVVIACTRADQTLLEPATAGWLESYAGVCAVVARVSARTGEGMVALRQAILRVALTLESVRARVPEAWQKVREAIEADDTPVWSQEKLHALYAATGVAQEYAREDLTEILCRLGLLLPGPPGLYCTPEWGGRLLGRLLDAASVVRGGGLVAAAVLQQFADGVEATTLHAFLEGWACALPLANGDWLVPALLPRDIPEEACWAAIAPVCLYRFPQGMPPGLLARVMARVRERVVSGLWWREGVVLQDASAAAQARMVFSSERSEVVLYLRGSASACRALLIQCHRALRAVQDFFPALPMQVRLPIPEVPVLSVPLEHVCQLTAQGMVVFIPEGGVTLVTLASLAVLAGWLKEAEGGAG
ncbi:MAG: leucine-rich repeat domain-containing protein [Magnetococcales bacterium]|nr:leucine-rich repeat domain-containing protein [Magnetococcales bacterium]